MIYYDFIFSIFRIITILERGLIQIWKMHYWPPKQGKCEQATLTVSKKVLTIFDLQISYYLVGIGLFLATLSLVFELIRQRCRMWMEKKGSLKRTQNSVRTTTDLEHMASDLL